MIKRLFDILCSFIGLLALSPILLIAMLAIWLQDYKNPLYIAPRVGKGGKLFLMYKLRSMVVNADQTGVASTSSNDMRITLVGKIIRKCKLDELSQLYNVLIGDMSFVGPRPNVEVETNLYTEQEKRLLSVRPGITDFASIVFSDEGAILADKHDPDLAYNQLIRPWKSRLGLLYIDNQSILVDMKLIAYTLLAAISKEYVLSLLSSDLKAMTQDKDLLEVSARNVELTPAPPPGADLIVMER